MFMDGIGMLLLTLPVVFPVMVNLGFDPVWFGIIVVKMVEVGLLTPPVGLNCYVVNGVRPDIPLPKIRSEEHTSELQSLMRISYAVFCLKKTQKKKPKPKPTRATS